MMGSFRGTWPCPRWVKTRETKQFETEDIILPNSITEKEVEQLPEHIGETYEECAGEVAYSGYYESSSYQSPGEDSLEIDDCDECDADNWSDDEIANFKEQD